VGIIGVGHLARPPSRRTAKEEEIGDISAKHLAVKLVRFCCEIRFRSL
jgi:hypothetical protein